METTQISFNWWLDSEKEVYSYNKVIGSKKKKKPAKTGINKSQKLCAEWKKSSSKVIYSRLPFI